MPGMDLRRRSALVPATLVLSGLCLVVLLHVPGWILKPEPRVAHASHLLDSLRPPSLAPATQSGDDAFASTLSVPWTTFRCTSWTPVPTPAETWARGEAERDAADDRGGLDWLREAGNGESRRPYIVQQVMEGAHINVRDGPSLSHKVAFKVKAGQILLVTRILPPQTTAVGDDRVPWARVEMPLATSKLSSTGGGSSGSSSGTTRSSSGFMALKVGPERERTLRRMPDASNAAPPVGRHDVANQSCVFHNLYREGGVWVLYLEAETGGSSNGQKTATDGKQDSTSTPPSRRKTLKLPEGVQFSSKYDSPHSFKTRTFKGINDLEAHLAAPRVAGCVGHELLLTFYVHLLFKHNIAHGLWDGLYASYVAMLRLGLGNAKVQFMTEYAKKRDSWKVEKIEPIMAAFGQMGSGAMDGYSSSQAKVLAALTSAERNQWLGRGRLRLTSEYDGVASERGDCWRWGKITRFDAVAMGVGYLGHMARTETMAMAGSLDENLQATRRFRDRLWASQAIAGGVLATALASRAARRRTRKLLVRVVANKRLGRGWLGESNKNMLLNLRVYKSRGEGENMTTRNASGNATNTTTPLWLDYNTGSFRDHLLLLLATDVIISSTGTANAYLPLLADQTAVVGIGQLAKCNGTRFTDWMELDFHTSAPWVYSTFVNSTRFAHDGVWSTELVQGPLDEAVEAVLGGFAVPRSAWDNMPAEGRVLLDLMALDPTGAVGREMAWLRNQGHWSCVAEMWEAFQVHELKGWGGEDRWSGGGKCLSWETGAVNRTTLRTLRRKYGLSSRSTPSDGKCRVPA